MSEVSHTEHDGCCAALLVKPSGEVSLVCRHTREALAHGLPLRVVSLKHSHKSPEHSLALVKVEGALPVICDAGESFELRGCLVAATPCDCQPLLDDHPEEATVEDR